MSKQANTSKLPVQGLGALSDPGPASEDWTLLSNLLLIRFELRHQSYFLKCVELFLNCLNLFEFASSKFCGVGPCGTPELALLFAY